MRYDPNMSNEQHPSFKRIDRVSSPRDKSLNRSPLGAEGYTLPPHVGRTEAPAPRKEVADPRPRITDEAHGMVFGEKVAAYGRPSSDFRATGRINAAILERWLESEGYEIRPKGGASVGGFPDIPPRVVALMLTGVKLSRESALPKHDNRADAIGYWLCADRIVEGY